VVLRFVNIYASYQYDNNYYSIEYCMALFIVRVKTKQNEMNKNKVFLSDKPSAKPD
jgi:hypothetical protein